jgi:hypothetical protein
MNKIQSTGSSFDQGSEKDAAVDHDITDAFGELEKGVHAALETYSNVHRGSGHKSIVSTHLFEKAREIVLEFLGLNKAGYVVIFCTPSRATALMAQLEPHKYQVISSRDIGLSIGVTALAVDKNALPAGAPFQTGGGTTRLISSHWIVWTDAPGIENTSEDIDTFLHVLGNIALKIPAYKDKPYGSGQITVPLLTKAEVEEQIKNMINVATRRVYS